MASLEDLFRRDWFENYLLTMQRYGKTREEIVEDVLDNLMKNVWPGWWEKDYCTEEEFKALIKDFTLENITRVNRGTFRVIQGGSDGTETD